MFCFNKNMGIELLTNKPIKFYQKNGVKFFERFRAVDKNRKPVELFMDEQNGCPTIFAKNHEGKHSTFELDFDLQNRSMKGKALIANPKQQELGQVVNLAALMTFYENKLNHFKIFAFRESMQFFAKFGFKVVTDNDDEIMKLLKLVKKSKGQEFEDLRRQADFFGNRVSGKVPNDVPSLKYYACNVFSNYLKGLARKGEKFDPDKIPYNSRMDFSDWEFQTDNKDYLNQLFRKHEINFQI